MHITGEASGGGGAERVLMHAERVALYFRCSAHLTLVYRSGRRVYPRRSLRHSITVLKKSIGDAVRELEREDSDSQPVRSRRGGFACETDSNVGSMGPKRRVQRSRDASATSRGTVRGYSREAECRVQGKRTIALALRSRRGLGSQQGTAG
jgi:hypothetical protein